MDINGLKKADLSNVLEIQCGEKVYHDVFNLVDANFENTKLYFKGVPVNKYGSILSEDIKLLKKQFAEETNFYDSIVKNLKNEAIKLNERLTKLRDNQNVNNDYIATLKSLRETLDLISRYDWELKFSEYQVKDDNDNFINQVSIWEQNHDNQIRNHKYWNTYGKAIKVPNML